MAAWKLKKSLNLQFDIFEISVHNYTNIGNLYFAYVSTLKHGELIFFCIESTCTSKLSA